MDGCRLDHCARRLDYCHRRIRPLGPRQMRSRETSLKELRDDFIAPRFNLPAKIFLQSCVLDHLRQLYLDKSEANNRVGRGASRR
jgi:hypothetical protein